MRKLIDAGIVQSTGLVAFAARSDDRTAIYAHEQPHGAVLEPEFERQLRENAGALSDFEARPASYRRAAIHWVTSARREETRRSRRFFVECSSAGRTIPPLTRPPKRVGP